MSKRKLLQLVEEGLRRAAGTTRACRRSSGLRRRGYTPEAIRDFCDRIGVAKTDSIGRRRAARALRARGPQQARAARDGACCGRCKVVIENYPEGQVEELDAVNNPEDPAAGHAQGAVLAGALHRAGRLPRGAAAEVLPAGARAARCACATPTSSSATDVVKDADRRGRRAALHLRPGDARRRRARRAQGQGDDPLGLGRSTPCPPRCASTTGCSPRRTPTTCRRARTSPRTSTRTRSRS